MVTRRSKLIRREIEQKLLNLVVVLLLPVQTSPIDALLEISGSIINEGSLD